MVNERVAHYIEAYKRKLCSDKKCPSDSSLRAYAYSIWWLEQRMDFPKEGGLPKPDLVLEYMENAKVTPTRRTAVYTALKKWHGCHGENGCGEQYSKPLIRAHQGVMSQYDQQKRSKRQQDNWVEFPVLKKFGATLRDEVLSYDKNSFWSKPQFVKAQLAFIILFHLRYPVRRDLQSVKWADSLDFQWGEKDNFLDLKTKEIVLRTHKTAKYYGEHRFKLSRVLWRIFAALKIQQKKRGIKGTGHLLLNKYYRPMTPNGFTSWMKREMKRCPGCEKKAIGCMIVRHCCITHKRRHEMTNEEKRKFAGDCMHSQKMNNDYRVN